MLLPTQKAQIITHVMELVCSISKKNNFITVNFLPGRLSEFDPRKVNAEIIVEKLAKGQVYLP